MNKFTSSILSITAFTAVSFANDVPMYDNNYTATTKDVMMLSQLLSDGKKLSIDVSGDMTGKRSFFSSLSENNDPTWKGSVDLNAVVDTCYSEENTQGLMKNGYVFKSRIADSTVVAYREAVKLLKDNGARYIFIETALTVRDAVLLWKRQEPMPFQKYRDMWMSRNPSFTEAELRRDHDKLMGDWKKKEPKVGTNYQGDDSPDHIDASKSFAEYFQGVLTDNSFEKSNNRFLPEGCFQDRSVKASDFFWLAGQVAALAIGVKGASMGNTNMASLGANTSTAVNNTASLMKDGNTAVDSKKLAGIALQSRVRLLGIIDPQYFSNNTYHDKNYKLSGYIFPIAEVEEHLSHYKVIPYNVKKITSN